MKIIEHKKDPKRELEDGLRKVELDGKELWLEVRNWK